MIGPNSCASESVREEDNGNMEEDNNQPMAWRRDYTYTSSWSVAYVKIYTISSLT
jgi:hypothetical protein